jgi:hypothetical protein
MRLRVDRESAPESVFPAGEAVTEEAWRMPDGTVWAYSRRSNEERWLELPGVARFRLGDSPFDVTAVPETGVDDDALNDAYRRIVVPIAFQARGGEVLHSSAVRGASGVVAFCADSQGGKSTMAYAMSRRGYSLFADDALALDFSSATITAVKLPFVLRLRPRAAQYFLGVPRAADHRPIEGLEDGAGSRSDRLAAVFFLERVERDAVRLPQVAPVAPARAFTHVLSQAFCFTLADVERKTLMMRNYFDLSASVPFFTLRMPSALERVDEALACVERVLSA